jgi:hypothetical protein
MMQSAQDLFDDGEDDSTGHEPESAHSVSRAEEKRARVQKQTTTKAIQASKAAALAAKSARPRAHVAARADQVNASFRPARRLQQRRGVPAARRVHPAENLAAAAPPAMARSFSLSAATLDTSVFDDEEVAPIPDGRKLSLATTVYGLFARTIEKEHGTVVKAADLEQCMARRSVANSPRYPSDIMGTR